MFPVETDVVGCFAPRERGGIYRFRSFYKHYVRAPRKAWCFLQGESPSRIKATNRFNGFWVSQPRVNR
jgi:hypothetical protein